MNKLTKGAIATAAGVTLLLGGAGTFALWNDTIAGGTPGTVASGQLQFTGPGVTGSWFDANSGQPIAPATDKMVPGDTFEYRGTVTYRAEGKNLSGELKIDSTSYTVTPAELAAEVDVTFLGGAPAQALPLPITPNAGDQTVDFIVRVHFKDVAGFGNVKAAQNGTVNLSALKFVLEQGANPAVP